MKYTKGKFFVDTNLLVYGYEADPPLPLKAMKEKGARAYDVWLGGSLRSD